MIRRILVALDGSVRAPWVFDSAAGLSARFDASLIPFRAVLVPPEFPAAAAGSGADPLPARMCQQALEEVARVIARAPVAAFKVERPVVRVGEPWRLILEVGDELDVDLIVVGSHGYHGLDRILGTTAARVANMAHRNVLVVHEPADRLLALDVSGSPYRRGPVG